MPTLSPRRPPPLPQQLANPPEKPSSVANPPPPPQALYRPKFKPPQSEGAGRGPPTFGTRKQGADFLIPPPIGEQPNPHTPCPASSFYRYRRGQRSRGSAGQFWRYEVAQVLPFFAPMPLTHHPPPHAARSPRPHPQWERLRTSNPLCLHMVVAMERSQRDRYEYPWSSMLGEPPGVQAPLLPQRDRPRLHNPVHSSAVIGGPWRPGGH